MHSGIGVGVVVGTANSVVAADDGSLADGSDVEVLVRRSSLQLAADQPPRLGAVAAPGDLVLDGFVARVGDPVGILAADGATYSGADLTATAIGCLVHEISSNLRGEPAIVAAYPTGWPRHTVVALEEALERAGFADVTPVPEANAALRWLEGARGRLDDGAIVVYDLGAATLDVTVLRTGESPTIIGKPLSSDEVSGATFDHLTMQHVLATVSTDDVDLFSADAEQALRELRIRCAAAKEALSADTETTVHVDLPGAGEDIRLVRGELEEVFVEPVRVSIELVREAVRGAGLELGDVNQVLLTGGGAAIPLVGELISAELGLPVTAAARPEHTSALGAAMLARDVATIADTPETVALPALAEAAPVAAAPAAHTPVALPTSAAPAATGMARWKKVTLVGAAVAAVSVLAAGGLAVGTGTGIGDSAPAPAPGSSAVAVPTTPGGAEPTATNGDKPVAATSAPNGPASADPQSPARTGASAPGAATPAPAPGTSAAAPPAAGQAAAPAGQPAPAPAPVQEASPPTANQPAPAPSNGGSTTGGSQPNPGAILDRTLDGVGSIIPQGLPGGR